MADVVIYHNPRCGNSRTALSLLHERGDRVEVVESLKTPLDRTGIEALLSILDDPPAALVRHDARFAELGLDPDGYQTAGAVADLLSRHPELMQRPVVVSDGRARIARPPAAVLPELLG
jgi:arsenate reductase